jgi:hypothetical protein
MTHHPDRPPSPAPDPAPEEEAPHLERAEFGWTQSGFKSRQAASEFAASVDDPSGEAPRSPSAGAETEEVCPRCGTPAEWSPGEPSTKWCPGEPAGLYCQDCGDLIKADPPRPRPAPAPGPGPEDADADAELIEGLRRHDAAMTGGEWHWTIETNEVGTDAEGRGVYRDMSTISLSPEDTEHVIAYGPIVHVSVPRQEEANFLGIIWLRNSAARIADHLAALKAERDFFKAAFDASESHLDMERRENTVLTAQLDAARSREATLRQACEALRADAQVTADDGSEVTEVYFRREVWLDFLAALAGTHTLGGSGPRKDGD